ncbi:hypothetical protein AA0Y32_07195 [Georgenia phoenicis]|uniref:hypothetical protein n=1 Tax=unclassified Georgenia TaxID=2626815 RepID=UPI0039B01A54
MTEGTDRPAGERRRRREAERAAALAAEQASAARPLTRRELRRLQEEEAARLEAAATGELPLGQPSTTAEPAATPPRPDPAATTPEPAPRPEPTPEPEVRPDPTPQPAATAPRPDPGPSSRSAAVTAPTPVSAPSAPSAPATAPTPVSAPSAASASSSAHEERTTSPAAPSASPRPEAPRIPSRRSLRERDPQPLPEERPQERTATGRRPVVRTPSVAQGIRALDSTGQLTGIQPVVRPDAPSQQPATPAGDATTAPAVWSERSTFPLDAPARAAREALPAPETADSPEEPEEAAPLRPRWVAIDTVSGASPESAASVPASRRALRAEDTEKAPVDERNPAVAAIKAAVLVVVALILGALIWLLATEAFDGSAAAAPLPTTITTTHLEESSAS